MKAETTKTNRFWGMAVVAVLLFAVIGVMPVAADNPWPTFHATYLPVQDIRSDINLAGNGTYYFTMPNGTGGMNAIHISGDTTKYFGDVYDAMPTSGTVFLSDTGGRGGQDDMILLIGVNSTNSYDVSNFSINLNVKGYQWTEENMGRPLSGYPPAYDDQFDDTYYNASAISKTYTTAHYLENPVGSGNDVVQNWKFAPLTNFPLFGGQVTSNGNFSKFILVDTNVGSLGANFQIDDHSLLHDRGMARVDYSILSAPSSNAVITMNVYAYGNVTGGGGTGVNWLNRVNSSTDAIASNTYSSWKITP
jgi:hypothetical protein